MNFPYHLQPEQPPSSNRALDSGDYELVVRQQPKEALVTQPGKEKNRKPVDPPPIIELKVTTNADPGKQFLQSPYLFMQCTLQVDTPANPSDNSPSQVAAGQEITGQSVSSLHRLKDINNEDGGFFVFGDISIKLLGKHRLSFSLFELRKDTGEVVFLKAITSEPFDVVQQKQWHGLEESTHLSRTFSDQGVRLRLRKENRNLAGSKRTFPYSPRGGAQAGPSSAAYGYDDDPNKRHRPNDHGQPQPYLAERAPITYDPRSASQNMQPATYTLQQPALLQSPPASFGSRTPTAPPGWQHQQVYNTTHPSASTPGRYPDSSIEAAQSIAPNSGPTGYGIQPPAPMGHEHGPPFSRRSTDSYMSMQHTQTSPTTPYQGQAEAMYIPTSGSIQAPSAYTEHDAVPMARQLTQPHSVPSPASSTRSAMVPAAPAYALQPPQLPPQTYSAMPDHPQFGYSFRQQAYPGASQSLLQQPLTNPNHVLDQRSQQPSAYMAQSHSNLALRPQQPGEPYAPSQHQQQYPAELGQGYQAPGGVHYPASQPPDQSRPY